MKTVLTGKYNPVPNNFSKELAQLVNQMLQLKPKNRPNCDKLLKSQIIQRKIEELHLNDRVGHGDQK